MAEIHGDILLRPTRIGFLTRPHDLASVRTIMRACTCVWGGLFNPIIPVFRRWPKEWKPEAYERLKATDIVKGYIRFFEPDVYVETEQGLLEAAGLHALRQPHAIYPHVITLKAFLEPDDGRQWSEPAYGFNMRDVLYHVYETDQRFVSRDKRDYVYVLQEQGNTLTDAIFGAYPPSADVEYIKQAYADVYRPETVAPSPDTWRRVFLKDAGTPLRVTAYGLDAKHHWDDERLIYVFDSTRATDLIDLWNLRLQPGPVLPVPVEWFDALRDDITAILKADYRPVIGNPFGLMHRTTIEFSRSIPKAHAESLIQTLQPHLPKGALTVKLWRDAIWNEHYDERTIALQRLRVFAKEQHISLTVMAGREQSTSFPTLEPDFSTAFGKGEQRWINALRISSYGNSDIATVMPFNTFDRTWPHQTGFGDQTPVGSEGWIFPQSFRGMAQYVSLLNADDAIVGSLKQLGITAELSEPGHIAKQMLGHLGGLWDAHLLADTSTLVLLNKMAGGLRRKSNDKEIVEERFELRTASLKDWNDLVSVRQAKQSLPRMALEEFTKRNIIRLGIETDCPHCIAKNWSTLTDVDYTITCERCLKPYEFPQASLRKNNANLTYRVVGPFSVPDFGKGSYGALLTLRFLDQVPAPNSMEMTFSTAMNLSFDGKQCEVDFVAWQGEDRTLEKRRPPQLIIGEAKSLGRGDLIKANDLAKLKLIGDKLPQAIIVIGVLRDHFTQGERDRLVRFVKWGRRANAQDEPTNPVLLLTEHELTTDHLLSHTWKQLGGDHARLSDYQHTRNLLALADATQQIYLGMPSADDDRRKYWESRMARRKTK